MVTSGLALSFFKMLDRTPQVSASLGMGPTGRCGGLLLATLCLHSCVWKHTRSSGALGQARLSSVHILQWVNGDMECSGSLILGSYSVESPLQSFMVKC